MAMGGGIHLEHKIQPGGRQVGGHLQTLLSFLKPGEADTFPEPPVRACLTLPVPWTRNRGVSASPSHKRRSCSRTVPGQSCKWQAQA